MQLCSRKYKLLAMATFGLWMLLRFHSAGAQQILYPSILTSIPTDAEDKVLREKGRKGLLFHFKYQDGADLDSNAGFPLDMGAATVTLTIGSNPPITCSAGINPAPGDASYVVVAGEDDPALDTVEILYNGDFPANTQIRFSVTGARSSTAINQNADPNVVTFTTRATAPRAPASLELVFDISGSMGWPAVPGGMVKRMDALKSASQVFFVKLAEYAMLGDKIGAVYFSTTATVFDPTPGGTNLEPAHNPTQVGLVAANVQAQLPTAWTSIGAGLQAANASGFAADPAPNARKSILLFSDGEQNTSPLVGIAGTNLQVGGSNYPAEITVCPITAGRMSAPGFALQQSIAGVSCSGQNAHVRDTEQTFVQADLETYFTQLLGNVLVGDKVELVRDVTGRIFRGTNIKEKFPANPNDVALSILLSWSGVKQTGERAFLPFRLRAPDGTLIDLSHRIKIGRNMSFTTIHFPLRQGEVVIDPKGEWEIELVGTDIQFPELNYHLIVELDNATIASNFQIEAQDAGTGEAIPIRVQLTDGGAPVLGATVVAQLLGPENGLGDILSTTPTPPGTPNPGGDSLRSAAQAKLLLLLSDPAYASLFKSKSLPTLVLLDNGLAANGDAVANDGIYSALFTSALEEGHYHFQVNARGTSATNGNFQRTRTLTVFVRPKPVAANTELTLLSSATQPDGTVIIRLRATPRDAFGNYIGPDYLGHLNIRSSEGTVESPLDDKLNGSYEISYRLPSVASDPDITLEIMGTTVVKKRLSEIKGKLPKWVFSLHTGNTIPQDSLANGFDRSLSLAADLEYRLTQSLSLEAYIGHDRFKAKRVGNDFYLTHVSGHGKLTLGAGMVRPAVHVGAGAYFAKGGDTFFGWNVGASVQYWLAAKFALEASYNFRNVDSGNLKYSTVLGGLRLGF